MILHAVLSLSAILGVIICLRYKGVFHKSITFGIAFSILAVWIDNSYVTTACFILHFPLGILTAIYGCKAKELMSAQRMGIITMGLFIATSTLFKFQHWPGATICRLMFVLPVILYSSSLLINKKLRLKEMSFMMTWLIHGLNQISRIWID